MMAKRERWGREIIIALSLAVLMIGGEWLGLFYPLRAWGEQILLPPTVLTTQKLSTIVQPLKAWRQHRDAAASLQELEVLYSQALATITHLENLEAENLELRNLLSIPDRPPRAIITSSIISYGQPSVNVGQVEGVMKGQPVLAAQTLVGVIKEVSAHQATLDLLGQAQTVPILAQTQTGEKGIIIGDGKRLILTELDSEAQIAVGDRVMTTGQAQIQPRLLIGQVSAVIDQPSAPVLQVVVEPVVSFYEVGVLEIWP